MVKKIVHGEGIIFFLVALYLFAQFRGEWLIFVLLFLTPDFSMLGYLKNKKVGALAYNLMHNYILPLVVIALGLYLENNFMTQLGAILLAHVGLDRFFGFGLKYPTHFKDTHLQKI